MNFSKISQLSLDCHCILCKNSDLSDKIPYICRNCLEKFFPLQTNICSICGHPLNESSCCISCSKLGKIYFNSYNFIQFYTDFFKSVVYKLKKEEEFMVNRLFFDLLLLRKIINTDGIITVVPDTFYKHIKKGRSSLKYLLKLFGDRGYVVEPDVYSKKLSIHNSQKTKSQKRRIEEVEKMYYLPKKNVTKYKGKVYLIDDVYTTGSTLNYGAKLLKDAGFNEVIAVSFFRAVLSN